MYTDVVDAPTGHVTLGANMANGIEQKGIESLQQCIKKCAAAGLGIPATVSIRDVREWFSCRLPIPSHSHDFILIAIPDLGKSLNIFQFPFIPEKLSRFPPIPIPTETRSV